MAKTRYLNNYIGLLFGYAVNTTATGVAAILNNAIPPQRIGTKVWVAFGTGINVNVLLAIGGGVQVTVTGTGNEAQGAFFTYSQFSSPTGPIRTPWNPVGPFLVARANNSVSLSYYAPAVHDLYFRTQKTPDSGSVNATLDGTPLGSFDLFSEETTPASVLLQSNVSSGSHTVTISAQINGEAVFVYFHSFEMLEQVVLTAGEYLFSGPAGTLDDSSNNFIGDWATVGAYAHTTDPAASIFFYPQLTVGGQVKVRLQKTPDSGIVSVHVNGNFLQDLDLYSDPAVPLFEITLLDNGAADPAGRYQIELRQTGTKNAASSGFFFYFHSTVVDYARTDNETLVLVAEYLRRVSALRGDGAFVDAWDSTQINFDANSLYACLGLLAAYQTLGGQPYLDAVKNFLIWFANMQDSDGSWNIGYQVNPELSPAYVPTVGAYAQQGISEIKWVDAVQCLPAFVLWWYWKLSGDNATKDSLTGPFRNAIDGFIANNYDSDTGFFFSSWQNKTAPTIILYHDAVRRYNSGGALIEQHNDSESYFTYSGDWSSYAPQGAVNSDEHFTLSSGSYVQFSQSLSAGDQLRWLTQSAWDTGIASILVSTNGVNFSAVATVDSYSASLQLQHEFLLYTAPNTATYWFRIEHSGAINPAGNIAPGWRRLASRFNAGQTDVALGLTSLWLLTREVKYATLAARLLRRFPGAFWSDQDNRWLISLDGAAPGTPNNYWYPMAHGYTIFGQMQSRYFQPVLLLADGLRALEPYQNGEGSFQPPGYAEAEFIFSAFYLLGENQMANPTNPGAFDLAKQSLKGGQYLLNLGGAQVGGIVFSKRYPYLYTNISAFTCLALAGTQNPFTEQLKFSQSRMFMTQ